MYEKQEDDVSQYDDTTMSGRKKDDLVALRLRFIPEQKFQSPHSAVRSAQKCDCEGAYLTSETDYSYREEAIVKKSHNRRTGKVPSVLHKGGSKVASVQG